jgi:hypothetical protein
MNPPQDGGKRRKMRENSAKAGMLACLQKYNVHDRLEWRLDIRESV